MRCPVCGSDYRAGFTHCPDRDVDLVDVDPDDDDHEEPRSPTYLEMRSQAPGEIDEPKGVREVFTADVATAVDAWRRDPRLVADSLIVFMLGYLPSEGWWSWFWLVYLPAYAGWAGTERIRYLRIFRQEEIGAPDVGRVTRSLVWPFVRLGILAFIPSVPFTIAAAVTREVDYVYAACIVAFIVVVVLAFVTPALAFSTRSAKTALVVGFGMLKHEWPKSSPYMLVAAGVSIALAVPLVLSATSDPFLPVPG